MGWPTVTETPDTLSPEAADVLLRWLVAGVAKSAPSDHATQEAIQYVITGRAERRLAAIKAPTPPDGSGDGDRPPLLPEVVAHDRAYLDGYADGKRDYSPGGMYSPTPPDALDVERLAIAAAARLEGEVSQLRTQLAACTEAYDAAMTNDGPERHSATTPDALRVAAQAVDDSAVLVPTGFDADGNGVDEVWAVHPDALAALRAALTREETPE
jgi:hypothetical protein